MEIGRFGKQKKHKDAGCEMTTIVSTWFCADGDDDQSCWVAGKEHAAVCGEERETRDGHYFYFALPPFAHSHPLSCSNMASVHAWLDAVRLTCFHTLLLGLGDLHRSSVWGCSEKQLPVLPCVEDVVHAKLPLGSLGSDPCGVRAFEDVDSRQPSKS